MAPILSFPAEEAWSVMGGNAEDSVMLHSFHALPEIALDEALIVEMGEIGLAQDAAGFLDRLDALDLLDPDIEQADARTIDVEDDAPAGQIEYIDGALILPSMTIDNIGNTDKQAVTLTITGRFANGVEFTDAV